VFYVFFRALFEKESIKSLFQKNVVESRDSQSWEGML